jgi:peptide/nickel transport system substrate-binding protein
VLRVEIRDSIESVDPPDSGTGLADLMGAFSITRWEAGRRASYAADNNAPGGRPFVDAVEVQMGRPLRDQSIDLEVGKADVIELAPGESRRGAAGRKMWVSAPVRIVALVFGPRVEDARVREGLALAVDRTAILNVLLQKQGEISGALLPQWISGYAFLFPSAADLGKARALIAAAPPGARNLSLGVEDASLRAMADRVALNARDVGLAVTTAPQGSAGDIRLVEVEVASSEPARALAGVATALGLIAPARMDSAEAVYNAERAMLDGFRVVPLFHLPDVYGAGPRVRGATGISPLGQWKFENVWLEGGRP